MQDSLPAGGLRLCRAGVEPAGSRREVSVHGILLSRAYPGAISVRSTGDAGEKTIEFSCPPWGRTRKHRIHPPKSAGVSGRVCAASACRMDRFGARTGLCGWIELRLRNPVPGQQLVELALRVSATRASTSASQAWGSTLLRLAVVISVYIAAARTWQWSEPQNSHNFLPKVTPPSARSAA